MTQPPGQSVIRSYALPGLKNSEPPYAETGRQVTAEFHIPSDNQAMHRLPNDIGPEGGLQGWSYLAPLIE